MIHIFIGTKAQLIKMAPIMKELQERKIEYNFVFSGQHQATIQDIQEEFGIKPPDVILYSGPDITGIFQMLRWFVQIIFITIKNQEEVWRGDKKGVVLNHGDTFSTLLGTVCAKIYGLKTAHIESGLRSFNLFHPFPEELTRRLTFKLTDIFFAPGTWAIQNLEKFHGLKINTNHNTLYDSLRESERSIDEACVDVPNKPYAIASIHRFENIFSKNKLNEIITIITKASEQKKILFILHKPTLKQLKKFKLFDKLDSNPCIDLRPRYSYFQFIKLVKSSDYVITDGGSNQEECFYMGKPCLIMRAATERQEGINKNALLSYYQEEVTMDFINNIDNFKAPPIKEIDSPSKIIVDKLTCRGLGY